MKKVFFTIFSLWCILGFSQTPPQTGNTNDQTIFESLESQGAGVGKVTIEQPFSIKNLVGRQVDFNNKFIGSRGYRIKVGFFSGNKGREKAYQTKSNVVTQLPDYEAYIVFLQPYFKVRIGNFFTKSQSLKALQEIKKTYPSAFIVADLIHFK